MRTIAEIMTEDCKTVGPKDTVRQAAIVMRDNDIGFVPVVEGSRLIGVVTDRDLVIRALAGDSSGATLVGDVLSTDVKTVSSDTSVDDAAELMAESQIRRLPVVDNGELRGVISIGDLAIREIFVNEAGEALSSISEHGLAH
ncbi:CBS domain-containing protein [Cohnella panacarvi]|uniref:CBS domain-containing protein n=1 Tax=Cohnella panacarvi TaxID=400776 RepID=UPI00047E63C3|nr:CBS domain-containing protein [Cohnella panacarvi]